MKSFLLKIYFYFWCLYNNYCFQHGLPRGLKGCPECFQEETKKITKRINTRQQRVQYFRSKGLIK